MFTVYTDGSCWTGNRVGAWAYVVVGPDGDEHMDGGTDDDTTISRMELLGPIDALEHIYEACGPSEIVVHSDSQYVVLGITNRSRKRKLNNDLWDWLDDIVDAHAKVTFKHVKGHAGNHYNEMVDDHAGKLRKAAQ